MKTNLYKNITGKDNASTSNNLFKSITGNDLEEIRKKREEELQLLQKENDDLENKNNSWIDTGAFDDGYDFGDITKTILGTTADAIGDFAIGAGKKLEGIENSFLYWLGDTAKNNGWDSVADIAYKNAKGSRIDNTLEPVKEVSSQIIEPNSVLGERSDNLIQNAGGTFMQTGITAAIPGGPVSQTAVSSAMMFAEASSNARTQALKEGATEEEAKAYGNIAGLAEAGTELMFGGLGKFGKAVGISKSAVPLDDALATKVSSAFKSRLAKNLTEYGIKAAGEGFEEVASGVLQAWGKQLTYKKDTDFGELLKDEDLLNSFIDGAIVSGIMQLPGQNGLIKSTKNDKDFVSGYTTNEQNVIDRIVDSKIKEAEENDEKVSKKEIEEQVKNDLEKGYIELDDIEKTLGGDTYTQYEEAQQKQESIQEEINEYKKMKDNDITVEQREEYNKLKEELSNQTKTVENLGNQLRSYVNELTQNDSLIRNSYNEYANKGNAYSVDLSQIGEKYKDTYQRAMDSGVLNDTNRSHDFVDLIAKLEEEKGVKFDFTNNEKLKDSSFALEGKQVNGYVNGDTITLNIDSNKALNQVVGHEITHILEGTDIYQELQDAVKEYATTKGEYEAKFNDLKELYKEVKDANIENELTSDLVGEYLFTDEEFVNRLSTQNRNLFEKIYDEIKYLAKLITSGSKEGRQLEKLKHTFEKAYRQTTINQTANIKYSLKEYGLGDFNKETLNNLKQKNINIINDYDDLVNKINNVLDGSERQLNTALGTISENTKNKIENDIGEKIFKNNQYSLIVNDDSIIHTAEHFKTSEKIANEIIRTADVVSNYDSVKKTVKGGQTRLIFEKKYNDGDIRTVETASKSNNSLNLVTTYFTKKNKNQVYDAATTISKGSPQSDSVFVEDNISQNNTKVNDISTNSNMQNDEKNTKYSISNQNEDIAPIGNYNIKGEDIKLQDIAPIGNYNVRGEDIKLQDIAPIETKQEVKETTKPKVETPTKEEIELPFDYDEPLEINGLDDKTINKITKNLKSELSLNSYEIKEFKNVLSDISKNDNITKEEISNLLEKKFGEKTLKVRIDEIADIKKELKNTKIFVPDYVKIDIPDYSDFRQRNYNKIGFSKEGQSIDKVYKELAEMHPEYFDIEIINEADQLQEIARIANLDKYVTDTTYLDESKIENAANWIYDSIEDYGLQEQVKKGTLRYEEYLEKAKENDTKFKRKATIQKNRELASEYLDNMDSWKDTPLFKQKINTMKRNLRDIMSKNEADMMYNEYFAPISKNNATIERETKKYNEIINNLKLSKNESTAVQLLGELKYNPETTLNSKEVYDFINKHKLNETRLESAVNTFRDVYDDLFGRVNKVLEDNGYSTIGYRKGYFPHFTEEHGTNILGKLAEKLGWKFNSQKLPTDIAGLTDTFTPGKKWVAFAQHRTGDVTDYNALKGFDNYIRGAMQVIHHTEDIQKLRGLENEIRYQYSEKGVQEKLDKIFNNNELNTEEKQNQIDSLLQGYNSGLGNFVMNLREYTNNLAGKKSGIDRSVEFTMGRNIYNTMNNISSRISANMVGLNFSSALTNFIPITQAWSQLPTAKILKATKQTIANSVRSDGFIDKSNYLTTRIDAADKLYKTGLEKVSDKANVLFDAIDSFSSQVIVRAKYLDNIENGMSEQEAINNADEFAKDVMAGRSQGDKPTIFNSTSPITKLFTAFQLEVNNQYGYMFKDLPNDLKDKGMGLLIGSFIKMFLGAWLYNKMAEELTGRKSAFSPIDIVADSVETAQRDDLDDYSKISSITKNVTDEVPFISGLLGGGRLPINSAIPDISTLAENAVNLKDEEKKEAAIKNIQKEFEKPLFYAILPFGGGQLKKTKDALSMYDEDLPIAGSYTSSGNLRFTADNSTGGKIKAALFGQYSSEEGQKYIDSGYKTISASKIDLLKDLKMSSSEFRNFQSKMQNATETTTKKDGTTYTKYFDNSGNTYWYDKTTKKLYDENFKSSNKNVLNLEKASSNELIFDYISQSRFNEKQKQVLFKNYFTNTTTDQYGYEKYKDSKNKTYWYDKDKKILYDSKYNIEIEKSLNDLTKVNKEKDLTDYTKYNSYEEADYSINNPEKYLTSKVVTDNFENYKKYVQDIGNISSDKDDNDKTIANSKKKKVINYINNLNEDYGSKLILYKMYYPKDNASNTEIVNYLNNLSSISFDEEKTILEYLGMKVTNDGTVRW